MIPPSPRPPSLEVVDPGLLLTIQDGGRHGLATEGVTRGGAADTYSLAVANALLGNPPAVAALEATLIGPALRALAAVTVALAGAMDGRIADTGEEVAAGASVTLRPGQTLALDAARDGARGYVAVPGGFDVPVVLGSRSTAIAPGFGGFEGRALRAGDALRVAGRGRDGQTETIAARWPGRPAPVPASGADPIRLLPGPHADRLGADVLAALSETEWTASTATDRVGIRLEGRPLRIASGHELASHGVVAGALQVPPDGRPIVLLVDHQPTGGYPVVAVVISADLPRLGQLAPGMGVAFAVVTPAEARAALGEADRMFEQALAHLRDAARWDALWQGAEG